jgi:flagellar biosynthesis/type III secretory pathway protein FliH
MSSFLGVIAMSSFKRIPAALLQVAEEAVSFNDKFILRENDFKKSAVQDYIDNQKIKFDEECATERIRFDRELALEKERVLKEAYEEGKKTAFSELESIIRDEMNVVLQETNEHYEEAANYTRNALEQIIADREKWLSEQKEALIQMIISITEKVISQETKTPPDDIEKWFMSFYDQIDYETKKIYVRVHPKTKELIEKTNLIAIDDRLILFADYQLSMFDLIVETDRENLELTVETKLKQIENFIREVSFE